MFLRGEACKKIACPEVARTAFQVLEEVASIAWIAPFGILRRVVTDGQT